MSNIAQKCMGRRSMCTVEGHPDRVTWEKFVILRAGKLRGVIAPPRPRTTRKFGHTYLKRRIAALCEVPDPGRCVLGHVPEGQSYTAPISDDGSMMFTARPNNAL